MWILRFWWFCCVFKYFFKLLFSFSFLASLLWTIVEIAGWHYWQVAVYVWHVIHEKGPVTHLYKDMVKKGTSWEKRWQTSKYRDIHRQTFTDRNGQGLTGTDRDAHEQTGTDRDRHIQTGTYRDIQGQTGTDWDRHGQSGTIREKKGQKGTDRDRQGQTETYGDKQGLAGTDRDKKGLLLLGSEKRRDETGTKPAKTEHQQNRDKKGHLSREKNRDQPSRDYNRDNQE